MSVYESIKQGLEEAIAYANGDTSKGREVTISISELPEISSEEIRKIRDMSHMTQSGFAELLGVSRRTVELWEKGVNTPAGPARRLMSFIRSDPDFINKYYYNTDR